MLLSRKKIPVRNRPGNFKISLSGSRLVPNPETYLHAPMQSKTVYLHFQPLNTAHWRCCCREKKSMSTCRIKNNSDIDNVDMKSVFGTVPPSPSIIHATHTIHDNHVESTVKASMTVPVRSLTLTQMMSTHYRLTSGKYISTHLKRI